MPRPKRARSQHLRKLLGIVGRQRDGQAGAVKCGLCAQAKVTKLNVYNVFIKEFMKYNGSNYSDVQTAISDGNWLFASVFIM